MAASENIANCDRSGAAKLSREGERSSRFASHVYHLNSAQATLLIAACIPGFPFPSMSSPDSARTGTPHREACLPAAAALRTNLLLRLWPALPNAATVPAASPALGSTETVTLAELLAALAHDLLSSDGVGPQRTSEGMLQAAFPSVLSALVAARRLELAMQGFARGRERVAGAILLYPSDSAEPRVHELLRALQPAQIALTQPLLESLQDTPGLELRPLSRPAGLYEFLWTAEPRLRSLQHDAATLLAPPAERPFSVRAAKPEADASSHGSAPSESIAPARTGRPLWIGVGAGVLAILIAVAAYFGLHTTHAPTPAAPAAQAQARPAAGAPAQQSPVVSHPQPRAAAPRTVATPAPPPDLSATASAAQKPQGTPAVPTSQPVSRNCLIPVSEIPAQLATAESHRQQDDLGEAERLFREVLACEPHNRQASDGLRRTLAAEKLEGDSNPE
jgi:hypothetical protein